LPHRSGLEHEQPVNSTTIACFKETYEALCA
jgi:hypothetical protein